MIERWSRDSGEAGMPPEILTRLGAKVRAHPWWRARAALVLALLRKLRVGPPARVLDAGCGWGVTLRSLEGAGYRVTGLDGSLACLAALGAEEPARRLVHADLDGPLTPPTDEPRFDAVLALDVLEHLDDDHGAVGRLAGLLRPGGVLLVTVPAGPDLFGQFDAIQGHRRRYRREGLGAALSHPGLEIERTEPWGRCLLPAARFLRSPRREPVGEADWRIYERHLSLPGFPIPRLLRIALAVDSVATLRGWGGSGTSILAVARRKVDRTEPGSASPADSSDVVLKPGALGVLC